MNNNKVDVKALLDSLSLEGYNGYKRDFVHTWDKKLFDIKAVLNVAAIVREMYKQNYTMKAFQSGLALSIFRDNSTRTRLAFNSASNLLGLDNMEIDEHKSQTSHGETVRETANMISFLTEVIGIRDDKYLGVGCKFIQDMRDALDEGYKDGVLDNRPTIVNLQDDVDHPTQSLADLLHIMDHFGGYENLKNKKFVMSWAYSPSYGKPLSVPQGLIGLLSRFGMNIVLAHPEGYGLKYKVLDKTREFTEETGGTFEVCNNMEQAFENADIVYPKSWAPFKVVQEKTDLLLKNDTKSLDKLEQKCLRNNLKHSHWTCDEKKMNLTKNQNALYMHCLPADISGVNCEKGEVSKDVFEKYRIATYNEAKNKPFIIAAMIMLSRFQDPAALLKQFYTSKITRNNPLENRELCIK